MNKSNLSQLVTPTQPAWIADPFYLKGHIKGLDNVMPKRTLTEYAQEVVVCYGSYEDKCYSVMLSDIPIESQNELARLYIESTGREITECVNGDDFSIESDYTCALLAMLKDDCVQTRQAFADITRRNIIVYYSEALQLILDNAGNSYQNYQMDDDCMWERI